MKQCSPPRVNRAPFTAARLALLMSEGWLALRTPSGRAIHASPPSAAMPSDEAYRTGALALLPSQDSGVVRTVISRSPKHVADMPLTPPLGTKPTKPWAQAGTMNPDSQLRSVPKLEERRNCLRKCPGTVSGLQDSFDARAQLSEQRRQRLRIFTFGQSTTGRRQFDF